MQQETINILGNILGPLVVGVVIWILGERTTDKRTKNDAIRDLMTFRGDYASSEFRRSLNKISITFHKDAEIRKEIRGLYEIINGPNSQETNINRKIVGLIYDLCQNNGFKGVTEYDIDQAFPESIQSPMMGLTDTVSVKSIQSLDRGLKKGNNDKKKQKQKNS